MTAIALATSIDEARQIAAAVESGALPAETVLVTANCAAIPEVARGFGDVPEFAGIAAPLAGVMDLNAAIEPAHPRDPELDARTRSLVRDAVIAACGTVDAIVARRPAESPASTLFRLFPAADRRPIPESAEPHEPGSGGAWPAEDDLAGWIASLDPSLAGVTRPSADDDAALDAPPRTRPALMRLAGSVRNVLDALWISRRL